MSVGRIWGYSLWENTRGKNKQSGVCSVIQGPFWPLVLGPCYVQEQRLRYLKQQEQRQQQQASEQEKLQRLRENIDNQETRLKKVRALKGQVEQKRLSNGKLGNPTNTPLRFLHRMHEKLVLRLFFEDLMISPPSLLLSVFCSLSPFPSFPSSGGDRTDEQPVPAEAEGTSDGCHQGWGTEPTAGIA